MENNDSIKLTARTECQSQHWKIHKKECVDIINEVHTPYPDQPRNLHHESKEINRKAGEIAKATKKAVKKGIPIITISATAQGMVILNAPLPDGVPSNFPLKQQAQNYFATGVSSKENNLGNLKYEKIYREYYDGILELEEEWMTFFSHVENYIHADPQNVINLTKGQVRKLLQKFRDMQQSHIGQKETQEIQQRVALMQCSSCGKHEGAIGEFKACSRCNKLYYCSRDCQKKDWKSHKKVCNKK